MCWETEGPGGQNVENSGHKRYILTLENKNGKVDLVLDTGRPPLF